jgi:hypothetical protein
MQTLRGHRTGLYHLARRRRPEEYIAFLSVLFLFISYNRETNILRSSARRRELKAGRGMQAVRTGKRRGVRCTAAAREEQAGRPCGPALLPAVHRLPTDRVSIRQVKIYLAADGRIELLCHSADAVDAATAAAAAAAAAGLWSTSSTDVALIGRGIARRHRHAHANVIGQPTMRDDRPTRRPSAHRGNCQAMCSRACVAIVGRSNRPRRRPIARRVNTPCGASTAQRYTRCGDTHACAHAVIHICRSPAVDVRDEGIAPVEHPICSGEAPAPRTLVNSPQSFALTV